MPFAPSNLVHATTGARARDLRLDPRRRGVVDRLQGQRVWNGRDAPSRGSLAGGSMFYFRLFHPSFHRKSSRRSFFFFSEDYRWPGISMDLWIFYSVYDFLSCSQDRGERLSLEQQHYQYNDTGWQAQVCTLEGCRSRAHLERRECRGRDTTRGGVTPGPGAPVDRARAASRSLKATSEPKTNILEKPAQESVDGLRVLRL